MFLLVEQLQVKGPGVLTAGYPDGEAKPDPNTVDEEEGAVELQGGAIARFRWYAARCMYLGHDRAGILFASKQVCREMSRPTSGSMSRVEGISTDLKAFPRLVWNIRDQQALSNIDTYTDANFAGCRRTRQSTSGGVIMYGAHCPKVWSRTQGAPAKSSAKSELFGVVRGACEFMWIASLYRDPGVDGVVTRLHMDASAALGILERQGVSRIRRLDADVLRLQRQQLRKVLDLKKVKGLDNVSDILTKHVSHQVLARHLAGMGMEYRGVRAATTVELHSVE